MKSKIQSFTLFTLLVIIICTNIDITLINGFHCRNNDLNQQKQLDSTPTARQWMFSHSIIISFELIHN